MLIRTPLSLCSPRLICAVVLSFFCAASFAAEPVPPPAHTIIPLDQEWRFWQGDDSAASQVKFDDKAWRTLDVPHDWSVEGPFNPPPEGNREGGFFVHGIGWYRKSFTLPKSVTGNKIVVEFDGVYMNSEVWINGHFLGRRPYGYIGFRYDLTDFLTDDGSPNLIAVRVDDSLEPSVRWYAGAGIYRHVRLIATGYTHFRLDGGIRITTPEITATHAVVEADLIVDAHFLSEEERQTWLKDKWHAKGTTRDVVLRSSVLGADGAEVAVSESTIPLESMRPNQRATQRVTVPKPLLWSDHTPNLYGLRTKLVLEGRTLDEVVTPFGIRRLQFDPDRGLLVNGQSIKLKGVCLHQDAGSFGNAVPISVWAWRLGLLKEVGCNAIRPSHHPFSPEFYDLCDRLGFYVFDEAFDEWTRDWPYNTTENPRGKAKYGYHLYFQQWHETDLRAMIRQNRNHPSIVFYSIGNEVPDQLDREGWKIAKKLVDICHEEDPSRLATAACDQSFVASRNGFMDQLDLGGYNYIDRLYAERTYAPERERFPRRIFLGTETTHQLHNWLGVKNNDYVIGEFLWTGFDYLGEARRLPRRGLESGLLDLAGGKKPTYYQRMAYWRDDPVLQLTVVTGEKAESETRPPPSYLKWNWSAGAQLTVRAITNCDEVELFLNDKSLGRRPVPPDTYYVEWPDVTYESGTLSAVAYGVGRKVASRELKTTGAPARLEVRHLDSPVPGDISLFEITVVDTAGLVVTDATAAVTVQIDGSGQLIGLDTGDLEYGGLFKVRTRNAYQGRLLATVRSTTHTGQIRLIATSPNLPTAMQTAPPAPGVKGAR